MPSTERECTQTTRKYYGRGRTYWLILAAAKSFYSFTDISSGFFSAARERFGEYSGIEFKTLDISRDPSEQGFEGGTYDLIIASNVIHATPSLNVTLKHVRKLLNQRGRFFLQELTPSSAKMINLIMGPLSGWWLGEPDGRKWEPIVSTERWDRELRAAGFSGIEAVVHDDPQPEGVLGVNMIARPAQRVSDFCRVTLLSHDSQKESQAVKLMEETLVNQGYHIDRCIFGQDIPAYQDIISLIEVDRPFISTMSSEDLLILQRILRNLGASRILWVMGSAQFGPENPDYGLTLGLTRSVRTELPVPLATLETDAFNLKATEAVLNVFQKFQDTATAVNPDHEFVLKDNIVHVGRYHWTKVSQELATPPNDLHQQALRLQKKKVGGTNVFNWVPFSPSLPGPDEVAVSPAYAGVTVKVNSMSAIPIFRQRLTDRQDAAAGTGQGDFLVGLEGSGTVTAIGSAVQTVKVGDRVMMIGANCLDTTVTVPSQHVVQIPDDMSFEEAATMPLAYVTAIYCMINVANLQRGQTVLIHSACSDVGLAALQISQTIGAEVSRDPKSFPQEGNRLISHRFIAPSETMMKSST